MAWLFGLVVLRGAADVGVLLREVRRVIFSQRFSAQAVFQNGFDTLLTLRVA